MADDSEPVKIEVFAILCAKCKRMEMAVYTAVQELPEIPVEIIRKTDVFELKERGVMSNPALIIDNVIVAQGNVPSVEDVKQMIRDAKAKRMAQK